MFLENSHGRIHYQVHGSPEAPTVLFTHGINMDHETFAAQVKDLMHDYRVITWDLPYHGQSSPIDHRIPFTETAVTFLGDLLEHLEVESVVLVGLSLGSYVTQMAAHRLGEVVKATVHIGGSSLYPPVSSFVKVFNPLIGLFITLYPSPAIFRTFASHRALTPETRSYLERVAAQNGKPVMRHVTQELVRDMARGLPEPTHEPKLLCHGDQEIAFVQRKMRQWHEACPNSRLQVISNAHHIANQDNSSETNRILSDYLEDVFK